MKYKSFCPISNQCKKNAKALFTFVKIIIHTLPPLDSTFAFKYTFLVTIVFYILFNTLFATILALV